MKYEIDKIDSKIESLENSIDKRLIPLTVIITKKGKLKGEISHMTKAQFHKFTGAYPRPSIIVNGNIPWHLALDTIAQEKGYKSDEDLNNAIKHTAKSVKELNDLKKERSIILSNIRQGVERETTDTTFTAPVFPKEEKTRAYFASIGDTEVVSKRNPSFHQVEVDYKSTPKEPDYTYRVRYAHQAKKLSNSAITDERVRLTSSRKPRISKRMPKLK